MKIIQSLCVLFLLSGCATIPEGLETVQDFRVERYLGKWFEIARFDHRFERGLSLVSAEYGLKEGGKITVVNRGYDAKSRSWKNAEGVAHFAGETDRGALKVSFFRPFYGRYNIIAMDPNYRWAIVTGSDRDYLWILARTPTLSKSLKASLTQKAIELGFDTGQLIWVEQQGEILR